MVETNINNKINNIDYFNIVSGLIFSQLYQNFPVPMDINTANFTLTMMFESDALNGRCLDWHYEELDNESQLVASILDWLIEEQYVRCSSSGSGLLYRQCVLSSKGLQTLSMTTPQSTSSASLGDQMVLAARGGFVDGLKDLTKIVVSEGGKILFQSAMDSILRSGLRP